MQGFLTRQFGDWKRLVARSYREFWYVLQLRSTILSRSPDLAALNSAFRTRGSPFRDKWSRIETRNVARFLACHERVFHLAHLEAWTERNHAQWLPFQGWLSFDLLSRDLLARELRRRAAPLKDSKQDTIRSYYNLIFEVPQPGDSPSTNELPAEWRSVTSETDAEADRRRTKGGSNSSPRYFENARYIGADIVSEHFDDCTFRTCEFRDCDFTNSSFVGTAFVGCVFERAVFRNVNLRNAQFERCQLTTVDFGRFRVSCG